MPKKAGTVTLKAKWKLGDSKVYYANAFQIFFTPYSCALYVGFIDPDALLPKPTKEKEEISTINLVGRYSLDMEAFLRLKNKVDKTYKSLKEMGALKDAKQ